jgi:ferredoxin
VHPGLCEAWGNCHRWAPDIYPLDADGKVDVHLVEVPPERAVEAWMGAEACPAGVISIVSISPVELVVPRRVDPEPAGTSPTLRRSRRMTATPEETRP